MGVLVGSDSEDLKGKYPQELTYAVDFAQVAIGSLFNFDSFNARIRYIANANANVLI